VILNEAIEVAKNLGGNESGAFVNGVLHRISKSIRPKAAARPAVSSEPQTEIPS
jgi:hypothetical protein